MTTSDESAHLETLQVSPAAEPEVIAAAYRALAKKYHPDRSSAADAPAHMARINGAYHALRGRAGRVTASDSGAAEPPPTSPSRVSTEHVDPTAPVEQILATITHMMTTARQRIIDDVTGDGVARDVAISLVASALRALTSTTSEARRQRGRDEEVLFDPASSYDSALRTVMKRAQQVKDTLTDEMVRDGLNRSTAQELADTAFERVRRKTHSTATPGTRLTAERVDLSGPLDTGVAIVSAKMMAARQMVIDELTRDGIPIRTAEQLVDQATQTSESRRKRTSP